MSLMDTVAASTGRTWSDRSRARCCLALSVLVAGMLGACGSDDAAKPAAKAPAGSGFPVTITVKQGKETIPAPPLRVVTLDFPSTDAVLALGVKPIAMAKVSYVPGDVQAWTKIALGNSAPAQFSDDTTIPFERIAALHADLIVGANAFPVAAAYAELRRIAPVVTWLQGAGEDSWQQTTMLVGQALGREPQARKLVADTEARVAQAAAAHPAFKDKTVTLFNYFQGTAYAISSTTDFSIRFLSTLGFRLTPTIARLGRGQKVGDEARVQVGQERVRLLDADVVLGTSSDSPKSLDALVHQPLFERLSASRRHAYATLDIGHATSIAFPSALSVVYALDQLVPLLGRLTA